LDGISFEKSSIECQLSWEKGVECGEQYFIISGYKIQGKVFSYSDPMAEVKIKLMSETSKFEKEIFSDMKGEYLFENVPAGQYKVTAEYQESKGKAKFPVEPNFYSFEVKEKAVTLDNFNIIGFSTVGSVMNSLSQGI